MGTTPFRLESVLQLRRQQLRHVEIELMHQQAELHRWQQREQEIIEEMNTLSAKAHAEQLPSTHELIASHDYRQSCYRQLQEVRAQQLALMRRLVETRGKYHAMYTELEKINTLKDEHMREVRRQLLRHENHVLGEIALRD